MQPIHVCEIAEMEAMFTSEERGRVREWIFAVARADERITGGAITGSRSVGREDRWSDVDTAFGVRGGVEVDSVLRDWTLRFSREFDVVHRFDLHQGATIYRVFLLGNGLEVDISLTPAPAFGPHGPTFQLVFGESTQQTSHTPSSDELIGWGWIFSLYGRAAIERARLWQAEYAITGVRNSGLALACLAHALPVSDARGADDLPAEIRSRWRDSLVRSPDRDELRRALVAASKAYLAEIHDVDRGLGDRLRPLLLG